MKIKPEKMKATNKKEYALEKSLSSFYKNRIMTQSQKEHPKVAVLRKKGYDYFKEYGFPHTGMEKWRGTDLEGVYEENLTVQVEPEKFEKSINEIFRCEVHGFNTRVLSVLNGHYYAPDDRQLVTFENGVIAGSLAKAQTAFPVLFESYFGELNKNYNHGFAALNDAIFTDGIFIYVPDGVEVKDSFQLIKILNLPKVAVNTRNLIILGKNSSLTFLHCDDSVNHQPGFSNTVTEIYLGENAGLNLYKLQNLNDESALLNNTFVRQGKESRLRVNVLSLNGGLIRNEITVDLDGEGADADISGLYLLDKYQHLDNQVYVRHNVPRCNSNELFKGILDNEASGVFNGYIYVARDAQQTNAFQRNNNILMKPDARIDTMPFLEIYADDVKCSHGATVGQLDEEAMFYMRQRGIPFDDARLLLLYAFAAEVTGKIDIDALRISIEDMVKRRLRGELSICDRCVLHCSQPDKPIEFEIDLSKI